LAVVRRTDVDDATAAAYLTGVSDLPAWSVEKACRQIGYSERGEYEDKWPELARIRGAAIAAIKADDERRETDRRLLPPGETPLPRERFQQLLSDVKALIAKKGMP
jgi:hypothetical protein